MPTLSLSGFVYDKVTGAPLADARVELIESTTGALTGYFALTNASGHYTFSVSPSNRWFRASKDAFEGEPRSIRPEVEPNATFFLLPLSSKPPRETILPGESKTGTVHFTDSTCGGMFFVQPCKRFILTVSEGATLKVSLSWSNADDLDLELWKVDTLIQATCGCDLTSEAELSRFVPAGEYELRATLFSGAGGSFTLTVTRID